MDAARRREEESSRIIIGGYDDDYDNAEEEVSDFEVFPGCYVIVEDTLELHMTAENAQMNLTAIANPLTESKTVSDKFTVGKDVPAGVLEFLIMT